MADQRRASSDDPVDQQPSFSSPDHGEFDHDDFNEDYASSLHTTLSRTENPFDSLHEADGDNSNPFDDTVSSRLSVDFTPSLSSSQPQSTIPTTPPDSLDLHSDSHSADASSRQNEDDGRAVKSNNYPSPSNPPSRQRMPTPLHLRTLSITSSSSYAPAGSPVTQDGNGPSHPYAMYPQVLSMSRPASVASVSTLRYPSRAHSRRGPAHPYALYPQNVGIDEPHSGSSTSYPIGFPGHQQGFHRRVGPEGEEQDIVGEDGHTEQLPPYSQFPEDAPGPKVTISGNAGILEPIGEISNSEHTGSPQDRVIEMQQRTISQRTDNMTSTDDLRHSPDGSTRRLREPSAVDSHDGRRRRLWWQRRVCGIPISLIWAFLFIILVIAIASGATVASLLKRHHGDDYQGNGDYPPKEQGPDDDDSYVTSVKTVTSTTYIDVKSISSATSSAPAPPQTGTFSIPISYGLATNNNCINNVDLQPAWACMMNNDAIIEVSHDEADNLTYVSMLLDSPTYGYGTQPPKFGPQKVSLVTEMKHPNLGPAYYFQTYYDKLVVVPYSAFTPDPPQTNKTVERHQDNDDYDNDDDDDDDDDDNDDDNDDDDDNGGDDCEEEHSFHRTRPGGMPEMGYLYNQFLQATGLPPMLRTINNPWSNPAWPRRPTLLVDKPVWFCYWNQTLFEGFLYTEKIGDSPAGETPSAVTNPTDYSHIVTETRASTHSSESGHYSKDGTTTTSSSSHASSPSSTSQQTSSGDGYPSPSSSSSSSSSDTGSAKSEYRKQPAFTNYPPPFDAPPPMSTDFPPPFDGPPLDGPPPFDGPQKRGEPYDTVRNSEQDSTASSAVTSITKSPTMTSSSSASHTSSSSQGVFMWGSDKFLKLQERRIAGTHITPYCVAVAKNAKGDLYDVPGVAHKYLPESDPPPPRMKRRRKRGTHIPPPDNACFCQWIET